MRVDLLFTILAIPAAVFAMMLGDTYNVFFKTEFDSSSEDSVFLALVVIAAIIAMVAATYKHINEYYDLSDDITEQIEKGFLIVAAACFGFFAYAALVGPINNGPYAWFDGFTFVALIACLPAVLHINSLIQAGLQERVRRKESTMHDSGVIRMTTRK